jgi:hypothetical protein
MKYIKIENARCKRKKEDMKMLIVNGVEVYQVPKEIKEEVKTVTEPKVELEKTEVKKEVKKATQKRR